MFKKSSIDSPPRIQRLRLRLQKYNFKLSFVPGKWMHTPDALSGALLKVERKPDKYTEAYMDGIINLLQVSDEK